MSWVGQSRSLDIFNCMLKKGTNGVRSSSLFSIGIEKEKMMPLLS